MEKFGKCIADKRKNIGMSLKDMAAQIKKDDGSTITPQYLNDIERSRRNPPSEKMILQIADILDISSDYLLFLAGKTPGDISKEHSPGKIDAAFVAFRKALKDEL